MIICVCNVIRENELRHAARLNPGDAHAVYSCLGKQPQCGQCLEEAEDILLEERDMAGQETLAA
ncbi:ferredoxin [Altericroceibacterium spongiae]|uniref:Ferredoxin n=1 Tax=Altericroceibacterium spongiae TaxID=2320269 RepID=A0A420EK63_9SPHN|nr:(2Fe-2S)-binding protein [Altericroceibacterium spongiae]RKF21063.1 ferredoxin [Altericroceibacterium spongiae]